MGAHLTRKVTYSKREATIAITGAKKDSWYREMVGNSMRVWLFRDDARAKSMSMGEWIEGEHFKVIKGKDIRRVGLRVNP